MAIKETKNYSPYVYIHGATALANNGVSARTGIFDSIQVSSDDAADDVTFKVKNLSGVNSTVKVSAGETIYGPYTSYTVSSNTAAASVIVHERELVQELTDITLAQNGTGVSVDSATQITITIASDRDTGSDDISHYSIQLTDSDDIETADDALLTQADGNIESVAYSTTANAVVITLKSGIVGSSWSGDIIHKYWKYKP